MRPKDMNLTNFFAFPAWKEILRVLAVWYLWVEIVMKGLMPWHLAIVLLSLFGYYLLSLLLRYPLRLMGRGIRWLIPTREDWRQAYDLIRSQPCPPRRQA